MVTEVGLMQAHITVGAPDDLFVKIGRLAAMCYQTGADESKLPAFSIDDAVDGDEEKMSFMVGGVVVFTADHDSHGWDGMMACKALFIAVAGALGMVQE